MSQAGIIQTNATIGATTYTTMAGNAAPVAGVLTIVGSNGINTIGAGGTVTINGIVQKVKVTLTSAQIKTLKATPITIIPAQGANTIIVPVMYTAKFIYAGTNQFTNGNDIQLLYTPFYGVLPVFTAGQIHLAVSQYTINSYNIAHTVYNAGRIDNVDFIVRNVGPAEFAGNAADDNTIIIEVLYYVSTLT
jgi:hypothetical protein